MVPGVLQVALAIEINRDMTLFHSMDAFSSKFTYHEVRMVYSEHIF